jgi:hypothetical protein
VTELATPDVAPVTATGNMGKWSGLCLAGAIPFWIAGLVAINPAAMTDFGLISVLPWPVWVACALVLAGFCLSLRASVVGTLPFWHLAALVLLLHATPAIAYETLRYSWAWKHIGIVDFIQRHGGLDPTAPYLAVYHNWPAFFLANAALGKLFDVDPLEWSEVARFFPTVLNLLFLSVLPQILRRFTTDMRLVWTAVAIFLAGNWVGQDYFSPQGTAYLLYLALLALCLGPLAIAPSTRPTAWLGGAPALAERLARFSAWASRGAPEREGKPAGVEQATAVVLALAAITLITVTHQLTPLLVIAALAGLFALGRLSLGYCLFAIMVELLWLFYFADTFVAGALGDALAEFGSLGSEFASKFVNLDVVSEGQRWVSIASRAVSGAIAAAAILGGLRRLRNGYHDGAAIVLTLSPLPLLMATSYGGEIVFRLYFFALPFLSFFAAALFFPSPRLGRPRVSSVALWIFLSLLTLGFVLANNGKDRQYRFTSGEVSAADWLYRNAPPGSLLVEGSRSYPSQFRNYENFVYLPLAEESAEVRNQLLQNPVAIIARWLRNSGGGYVIITSSQKANVDDLGIMPVGALEGIERTLSVSAAFRIVHATSDARVFALVPGVVTFDRP